MMKKLKSKKGFTLVEVMIATLILAIVVVALVTTQDFMSKQTVRTNQKTFANQKAISLIEELRSMVYGGENADVAVLDDFDDGTTYKPILTTDLSVTDPADPLSSNDSYCGGWKYLRKISVSKLPEDIFSRIVYVRIYKTSCKDPSQIETKLAETMTILKTVKSYYTSAHVYDLYIIALENLPTTWNNISNMRSDFSKIVQDIQTNNPGLEIRTHWITRFSYGRDPFYAPYINTLASTDEQAASYVYLYPGLTKDASGGDFVYYDPNLISARLNVDGILTNTDSYSIADYANHAVRYPRELEIYDEYVNQAQSMGISPPEISLRMFLEQLNSPQKPLENALIINLHEDIIPLPPMRNYSDAAKDPQGCPDCRAVTHPEKIYYPSGENIKLRVYSYLTDPDIAGPAPPDISIVIENKTTAQLSGLNVQKISGDAVTPYTIGNATAFDYSLSPTPDGASAVIVLKNSPLKHPLNVTDDTGLNASQRLYGLEYIPSPINASFAQDLTTTNPNIAKNTARWVITLPASAFASGMHKFTTRIGSDITTGTSTNKPCNISRNYVWVNTAVPVTEQYQFIGDPRHNPYKDVQSAQTYNWYHNAAGASYGYAKAQNGWGPDFVDADIPRFFQIYRKGLINSQSLWCSMSGFGYYYYGLGGEFGSWEDPLPNGIPFVGVPWSASGSATVVNVDEMVSPHGTVTQSYNRVVSKTNHSWFAMYSLGELFPDSEYLVNWSVNGNLPTGATKYYRTTYANAALTEADWNYRQRLVRLQGMGGSSFFNSETSTGKGPFKHAVKDLATSSLNVLGMDLSGLFSYALPSVIKNRYPWRLDETMNYPPEWNDPVYSAQRVLAVIPLIGGIKRAFFDSDWNHPFHTASGVIRIKDATTNNAYILASGVNIQPGFVEEDMARYTVTALIRSFFDGGLYSAVEDKITQLPRIEITTPSVTAEIPPETQDLDVSWQISWKRWNGFKYTFEYPDDYEDIAAENDLIYHMKYSSDNGTTWKFCQDGSLTEAGERSSDPAYIIPQAASLPVTWNIPTASYPEGIYLLRVESFRNSIVQHYSYDQQKIFIQRD